MKTLERMVLMMVLVVLGVACGNDDGGGVASAAFKNDVVNWETTQNQLLLTGGDNLTFTATIVEGTEWLSFSAQETGVALKSGPMTPVIFIYSQKNTTPDDRTARVVVAFSNNDTSEVTLTQQKYTTSASFDKAWAEQPQFRENSNFVYKTYYTTLSKATKPVRNYSICYDVDKKVAQWVAYPLHTVYTTPYTGRSDEWAYDPNVFLPSIPNSNQQYVIESYKTGYARGHQCASADRQSTLPTNEQTYYGTNIMPQDSKFNGGIWLSLENKVRDNMCNDTLYVVTGTYFANSQTTTDRKGNRIGLPSNCWKVLLRTKNGNTGKRIQDCTADELIGIGFWFANNTSNGSNLTEHATTIADIEERTGFTFFHNIPSNAHIPVKSQNDPSVWKIQ